MHATSRASPPLRVHWLQHVPFEGLGSIGPWLQRQGHQVSSTRLHAGEPLPQVDAFDWLIVMGGPMNVDAQAEYPWLAAERQLVGAALAAGKRYLGICLGAQIMARALGAAVTPGQAEIGWFDVTLAEPGAGNPLLQDFPRRFAAFHWHGDHCALPPDCIHAATSNACRNQAFIHGSNAIGLQFHLETTAEGAAAMAPYCADELVCGDSVQARDAMFANPERFGALNQLMDALLARLEASPG